jgi:hypothetical protein
MSAFKKNKEHAPKEESDDDWDIKSDKGSSKKKLTKRASMRMGKKDSETFDDTMSESTSLSSKKAKHKSVRGLSKDDGTISFFLIFQSSHFIFEESKHDK